MIKARQKTLWRVYNYGVGRRLIITVLCVAIFLDLLGFGMAFPDIALRAESFGASGLLIGTILASLFAVQFLTSPRWGALSDRIGRKPVVIACTLLSACSMVVYGLATNVWIILASRIIAGLAAANVVVAQAYVADQTSEEERAGALGKIGASLQAGLIAGPVLGGTLATMGGNRLLGFVAAGASLTAVLLLAFLPPEPARTPSERKTSIHGFGLLKEIPSLLPAFLLCVLCWFSLACLEGTFGRLIKVNLGFGQREFGWIFGFESALGVIVQALLISALRKRFGDMPMLRLGFAFQGLGLLLTPFAPALAVLFLFSGLYAVGSAFSNPVLNSIASKLVPDSRQGELFGLLQQARSFGFLFGPIIGGHLFDIKPSAPYILAGGISLFAAAIAGPVLRPGAIVETAEGGDEVAF